MLVKTNNEHLASIVSSVAASAAVIEENIHGAYVVTALNSRFSDMFRGRSATRDAVVEAAYDSIITINQQSQIILFNQAAQKLFGYDADEIIGEPIETLMPEKYRAEHGAFITAFERMPVRSREMSDRNHVHGRHKTGREFPVEIAISKIDVHGTIEYTAIVRDASDRLQLLGQLAERARTDHLTGLINRREFDVLGHELFETSVRNQKTLSVLMLDLDHFKRINDNHGHHIGDEVLKFAAQLGEKNVRSTDIFARMGGEEFVLLMPDADERIAAEMAERIRHTYERQSTRSRRGAPAVPFTVSIGTATLTEADDELGDLLKRADKALYRAKQTGRNRVEIG